MSPFQNIHGQRFFRKREKDSFVCSLFYGDFKQAGETYRNFKDWERDEPILNLVNTLALVKKHIQDKMVELFTARNEDYGRRVAEGLRLKTPAGSLDEEAVQQAEIASTEADPY